MRRLDEDEEEGGDDDEQRGDREDDTGAGHREEETGESRAREHRDALDAARDGVCGGQLLGRLRECRCERRLRGAERRRRNRGGDRQHVDDERVRVDEDAECGGAHEHDPRDVRPEEDTLTRVAVAEHPRERRDERGRDQPREEDEPDGLLPADVVRVDGHRDEERVLADDRRRPGELEPAQVRIAPYRCECGQGVPESPAYPSHGAEHLIGSCLMEVEEGRFPTRRPSSSTEPARRAPTKEEHGMSDEIYTEDEVEAHGPLAEGPTAEGPFAEGPTAEATDDEPDFEAHGPLAEGPFAEGPTAEGPFAEGPTAE